MYTSSYSSYDSGADSLMALLGVGGVLLFYAIFFLVFFVVWFVIQYPYYKMAKNQGLSNAWLAYVPYGNFYITLKLSPREFNVFNWIRWENRTKAFWTMLIATGIYIVLLFPVCLIAMIPVIGWLIYIVYIFAYVFIVYALMWRMNYDLLITYGMEQHAMWASIVNIFCPFVMVVFAFIIMNKEPNYNA